MFVAITTTQYYGYRKFVHDEKMDCLNTDYDLNSAIDFSDYEDRFPTFISNFEVVFIRFSLVA